MKRILLIILAFMAITFAKAQTFSTSTPVPIPDYPGAQVCSPITVSGVGTINSSYGLATVCINISHTWDGDLVIVLKAPDGTTISLSNRNGGSGDNYTGTCFDMTAATSITAGTSPFTGSFIPQGSLGVANNGQNANGTWSLCAQDMVTGDVGTINSWSITFNNTPAPPPAAPPACNAQLTNPANTCNAAPAECDLNGLCGSTYGYTANTWTSLTNIFCGSIENNSFLTFTPSAATVTLNVYVWNSTANFGIQMFFFSGSCGGTVTSLQCVSPIAPTGPPPTGTPYLVTVSGLTPGTPYHLMFDGYAGDSCNYQLVVNSGVTSSCPLPVSLLSFTAKRVGAQSLLQWQTATETNTSHFIVEHSTDGITYHPVGTVAAAGNSTALRNYTFTHPSPAPGNNFYRLQEVDRDLHGVYSSISVVKFLTAADIQLYPNPARSMVTIDHPLTPMPAQIKIIDMMGRVIKTFYTAKDAARTTIDLKGIASGSYKVLWSDGANHASRSLLVQ